jgi:copper(I)-binding protein
MKAFKITTTQAPSGLLEGTALAFLVGLAIMLMAPVARADASPERFGDVTIIDAAVQSAPQGGNSEVRFRLVNESAESLTIIGVDSGLVSGSKILARTGHGQMVDLGSISVPAEETLNLHSSHLKIELTNVKRELQTDDVISLNLVLMRGTIPFKAHVHALPPDGHKLRTGVRG